MHTTPFSGRLSTERTRFYCSTRIGLSLKPATRMEEASHVGMRHDNKEHDVLRWQNCRDTTRRHQICPLSCTCSALLLAHYLCCIIQQRCFDACHTLGSASCIQRADTTLHDTILHRIHTARRSFALPIAGLIRTF